MNTTIRNTVRISRLGTLVVAMFALTAGAGRALAEPNGTSAAPLDDARIVRRVLEFDGTEVQAADAVKGKFSSPLFWQFAQRMRADHATVDEKFRKLTAESRQSGGDSEGRDLVGQKLTGDDLEKAYVDREIQSHEAMLAALERELIPNAKSDELRSELMDLVTQVKAHLEHARYVQAFLSQFQQAQINSAG